MHPLHLDVIGKGLPAGPAGPERKGYSSSVSSKSSKTSHTSSKTTGFQGGSSSSSSSSSGYHSSYGPGGSVQTSYEYGSRPSSVQTSYHYEYGSRPSSVQTSYGSRPSSVQTSYGSRPSSVQTSYGSRPSSIKHTSYEYSYTGSHSGSPKDIDLSNLSEEMKQFFGEGKRGSVLKPGRRAFDERRGAFDCKQKGAECGGVIKCCGSMQCYWADGYSAIKDGKCVDCVANSLKCQRDEQCCGGLICQKANGFHVDGVCGNPKPSGEECHDDDQCRSGKCNIGRWANIKGEGGKCA